MAARLLSATLTPGTGVVTGLAGVVDRHAHIHSVLFMTLIDVYLTRTVIVTLPAPDRQDHSDVCARMAIGEED